MNATSVMVAAPPAAVRSRTSVICFELEWFMPLRLFLFGAPRLAYDTEAVRFRRSKALALLAYVAVTGQPQQRDTLLTLVWPEFDAESARSNLRRELSLLKRVLPDDVFLADRLHVAWNPKAALWLDVAAFQEQIAQTKQHDHLAGDLCPACADALAAAARLYTDDFMAGFSLPDSLAFDEWQFFQREELRQQFAMVLQTLVTWQRAQAKYPAALGYARRWLALDHLNEAAQRELMRLYVWTGQQAAAVRQYEACVRLLDAELGAEPEAETTDLYQAIKARRLVPPVEQTPRGDQSTPPISLHAAPAVAEQPQAPPTSPHHNLPPQTTPFVGREEELAVLHRYLTSPEVRMTTIVGAGGMGKTRLALAAAERHLHASIDPSGAIHVRFPDGVFFVPLAVLTDKAHIVPALVDALDLRLEGGGPHSRTPQQQVIDYLSCKTLLLVLDNFEHLLDGADVVSEIGHAAPNVTMLVTSRERLYLHEEHVLALYGLAFPHAVDGARITAAQAAAYAAIQLFVQRAQRAQHDLALTDATAPLIAQICRLVEGMPLAVELAAAWVDTLSLADITTEIQRSLDFLETDERNVPVRQRSIRAVFDATWQRLTEDERAVFAPLSIFQGGFEREAAHVVTGASLRMLARLVNKSLLRTEPDGRYHMHELLRQFAEVYLHTYSDQAQDVRRAYGAYYLAFLCARFEQMIGARQREATAEIAAEIDNIRATWSWLVEHANIHDLRCAAHTLTLFFDFHNLYGEGVLVLEQAIDHVRTQPLGHMRAMVLAALLVDLGGLYIRVGRLREARTAIAESLTLHADFDLPLAPGITTDPVFWLGVLALIDGNYAEAAQHGDAARQRSAAQQHRSNLPYAWYVLTNAAQAQGQYDVARQAAEHAYAAVQVSGDRWFTAYCLNELGNIAIALGHYAEARHHYQVSYTIREEFSDRQGMAVAELLLGKIACLEKNYGEARSLFERSLALHHTTGDRGGTARSLAGLGITACAVGDYQSATERFAQALELATEIRYTTLILNLLANISELLVQTGRTAWGPELLALVLRHPSTDRETLDRAQHLLRRYKAICVPGIFGAATVRGEAAELDDMVARVQVELALPVGAVEHVDPLLTPAQPLSQPLIEPLTEREQDVMQLLAEGLSNQEIADRLIVAVGTVKWYTRQIYGKLSVQSRTQAIAQARELGLLS